VSDRQVLLREWTDSAILPAGPGDSVAVLALTYSDVTNGQRTGTVYGVTRGAAKVRVTVATASVNSRQEISNLPPSGLFSASFSIASSNDEQAVISARNVGAGMTSEDRAAITFGDSSHLAIQTAPASGLDPARLRYGAGNADRIHPSRTFVSLQPPVELGQLGYSRDVYAVAKSGGVNVVDAKAFKKAVKATLDQLNAGRRSGAISMSTYWSRLRTTLKAALNTAVRKATPKERGTAIDARDRLRSARFGPKNVVPPKSGAAAKKNGAAAAAPAMALAVPSSSVLDAHAVDKGSDLKAEVEKQLDERVKYAQHFRRLGVLLHDRLRFRASNLVVGEPLFQLALTPG
jgi:hypothetical protein